MSLQPVLNRIRETYGFLTEDDRKAILAVLPNFTGEVLVRCGRGRFKCNLQRLPAEIERVESTGDYVRDVSVPVRGGEGPGNARPPEAWEAIGYKHP